MKTMDYDCIIYEGGGSKEIIGIAITKYMYDNDMLDNITLLGGASAGGLDAVMGAKYLKCYEKAVSEWLSIKKNSDVYKGKVDFFGIVKGVLGRNKYKSILIQQGLFDIIDRNFEENENLEDLPIKTLLTGTDLTKGVTEVYTPEKTKKYNVRLMAKVTSSIPILFQCQEINGKIKADGGIMNNAPILDAIKLGAKKILFISVNPDTKSKRFKNVIWDILIALLTTLLGGYQKDMWTEIKKDYPHIQIYTIKPDKELPEMIDFTKIKETYDYGYELAKKHLG